MWDDLGHGVLLTLGLIVLTYAGAVVLGVVLAVFRISPVAPLRAFAAGYVTLFRNIPLLVLLVLFTFGLPDVGLLLPLYANAALAMALYWAAFVCEVARSGARTVPRGQIEAARALGLTFTQSLRHVLLPQALRAMVQPLTNIFIGSALGTSLAAAAGVTELSGWYQNAANLYDEPLLAFAVSSLIYAAITLSSGLVAGRVERKLAIHR